MATFRKLNGIDILKAWLLSRTFKTPIDADGFTIER